MSYSIDFDGDHIATAIALAIRKQIVGLTVGTGTFVLIDTSLGYEEDGTTLLIDCDTIADAVLKAIQEGPGT